LKERLDVLLVRLGYFESREKAKAAVMAGLVYVDKQRCDKAGTSVKETALIEIKQDLCPYVGRGGLKLEKALQQFDLNLEGCIAMDIGASTGGFTDCMLQKGASKVYAIDVGYGQLHYKLRNDPRVVNIERMNIRYLDPATIEDPIDFISIDVSFISVNLVFPVASELLKEGGRIVCLIKPQFEAGRSQVGKHGIVKERSVHAEVIRKVMGYGEKYGLKTQGLTWSPITGAKGNIEYLILFRKGPEQSAEVIDEQNLVNLAFDYFSGKGNPAEICNK
jgi:23S rRNA (cytidine1920-2'-O)/16S rRNA (cytidine1409-2'-O)-methyltransferase